MNPLNAFVERARTVNPSGRVAQLVELVRAQVERPSPGLCFSQLHIDVARNATDDFNPFHDAGKWKRIADNPFQGPIALGFQLETLLAESVERSWRTEAAGLSAAEEDLPYARYSFTFAGVVHADERVAVEVRPGRVTRGAETRISHRAVLRKAGRAVVMGRIQRMARRPDALMLSGNPSDDLSPTGGCFLREKVLQASDAKNLLSASQVSPHRYFDELEGRAQFPDLFPVSLISSALLEKAAAEGHDFLAQPMVYTSHSFFVDRRLTRQAVSGDRLCILVEGPTPVEPRDRRKDDALPQSGYRCLGLLNGKDLLFRAEVRLALLQDLVRTQRRPRS